MIRMLGAILVAMRPGHWTKNLVVFAALIFSRNLQRADLVLRSLEAFVAFCLLSGVVYLVNDIADAERDRLHPRKRTRPVASGRLGRTAAGGAAAVAFIAGVAVASVAGPSFVAVAAGYVALNVAYSLRLKRIVLLDAMSISVGFILRAIGGVEALRSVEPGIAISPWLLICTLFLSLFLAFCKRRHELLAVEDAVGHRAALDEYTPASLDALVAVTAGGSVIAYAIYTIWPATVAKFGTGALVYTVPLVLLGVMRYLHLVYARDEGGSPADLLLGDRFLLVDVLAWVALVVVILREI